MVRTTADEHHDATKESINTAIDNLSKIVVDRVGGSDDYTLAYRATLRKALNSLLDIRDDLV